MPDLPEERKDEDEESFLEEDEEAPGVGGWKREDPLMMEQEAALFADRQQSQGPGDLEEGGASRGSDAGGAGGGGRWRAAAEEEDGMASPGGLLLGGSSSSSSQKRKRSSKPPLGATPPSSVALQQQQVVVTPRRRRTTNTGGQPEHGGDEEEEVASGAMVPGSCGSHLSTTALAPSLAFSPAASLLSSLSEEDHDQHHQHHSPSTNLLLPAVAAEAAALAANKRLADQPRGGAAGGGGRGGGGEEEVKDPGKAILQAFASGDGKLSMLAHQARAASSAAAVSQGGEGGHNRRETEFSLHGIRGALDGVLVSVSLVAAAQGAGLDTRVMSCLGVSVMAALSVGVGLAHYRADREDLHYYRRERRREEWEMENFLAGERSEMIELFQHKGLEPQDAVLVIDTLLHCKPVFLDLMMVMELGLLPHDKDLSRAKGLVAFGSLLLLGGLPLLPYLCHPPSSSPSWSPAPWSAFWVSCALAALALVLLGAVKARLLSQPWAGASGWMLAKGAITMVLALALGRGLAQGLAISA